MKLRRSENKSVVVLVDKANTDMAAKSVNRKSDLGAGQSCKNKNTMKQKENY